MKFNRWINGLISATLFVVLGIPILLIIKGNFNYEKDIPAVIGLAIGGFIAWAFVIPAIRKIRSGKEKD